MLRKIGRLFGLVLLVSGLSIAGGAFYTQYIFQEPFHVSWSRFLKPELDWQKGRYPSLKPVFGIAERLFSSPDPRNLFGNIPGRSALTQPATWSNAAVGPQSRSAAQNDVTGPDETIVSSAKDLRAAIGNASPGETITISPGEYLLSGHSIKVSSGGTKSDPIILRARKFGTVRLLLSTLEGFHVRGPNWIFENLIILGVCARHARCEHAFHVVGDARGTVIRNNWISNFNAALKVNGVKTRFPDDGRVSNNVFINDTSRQTSNPVTLIDIVGASNWTVDRNFIADFAKAHGDRISYGAYFKGAGTDNIFERNLVRCERMHRGGTRVGLSFGGGGTDRQACRDGRCRTEQSRGVMRFNIVMNCPNSVGIYLNKSTDTRVHNNLLVDTRGIDVRFSESTATIRNNVIDGRIRARNGGSYIENGNITSFFQAVLNGNVSTEIFADPRMGDLSISDKDALTKPGRKISGGTTDFCNRPLPNGHTQIGPFIVDGNPICISIMP